MKIKILKFTEVEARKKDLCSKCSKEIEAKTSYTFVKGFGYFIIFKQFIKIPFILKLCPDCSSSNNVELIAKNQIKTLLKTVIEE